MEFGLSIVQNEPAPILLGWRRSLLRLCGAKIGHEVHILPTACISIPWNLEIGDYSSVGSRTTQTDLIRDIIYNDIQPIV